MSRARALCPDAVVLPPDMARYARVGREIRARMLELTPLVEPLSIDEAFLDLTGCDGPNGASAAETLARFAQRVEVDIGVTVSVGLSYCKFLAKLASDLDKPRGFTLLPRDQAKTWLAPQSVGRLWGVGRIGRERLERSGFRVIGDLQQIDEREAVSRLGDDGLRLWRLALGRDDRSVSAERETKSISSETTFDCDIDDKAELIPRLVDCDSRMRFPISPGGPCPSECANWHTGPDQRVLVLRGYCLPIATASPHASVRRASRPVA